MGAPIILAPPASRLTYTVFALGVIPVAADFSDFAGTVTFDPAHPSACQVQLTVRVGSLGIGDPYRAQLALGRGMLDAAHYPTMHFEGACAGSGIDGWLTLHGITRRLRMSIARSARLIWATGSVQRRDYGVDGFPGLVGASVRFVLRSTLPFPAPP